VFKATLLTLALSTMLASTATSAQATGGSQYFFMWTDGQHADYFALTRTGGEIGDQYVTVARTDDGVQEPQSSSVDVTGSIDGSNLLLTIAGERHVRQGLITSEGLVLYGPATDGILSGVVYPASSASDIDSSIAQI
jgi:hypothetical protein